MEKIPYTTAYFKSKKVKKPIRTWLYIFAFVWIIICFGWHDIKKHLPFEVSFMQSEVEHLAMLAPGEESPQILIDMLAGGLPPELP